MNPDKLFYTLISILITASCFSQEVRIGTNILYWGTTTPNLSFETALGEK